MTIQKPIELSELTEFIEMKFTTITQIEVLLFFRKLSYESFSTNFTCNVLHLSDDLAAQILSYLNQEGLLHEKNGSYKYNKESPYEANGTLEALNDLYVNKKTLIIQILFKDQYY